MDLEMKGRVALVNGASRGLGRAAALAIADEGATVIITGRDPDTLQATVDELSKLGAQASSISCDLTERGVPTEVVQSVLEQHGRLDILVVNSGGPPRAKAFEMNREQLDAALTENLLMPVEMIMAAVPSMRAAHYGRICCISSVSVVQALPELALSNTARTGLWAWVKTAAHDLRSSGVTLNLACPSTHPTGGQRTFEDAQFELGDPADFGRIVAFMCSETARYMNGHALVVDGGRTLAL